MALHLIKLCVGCDSVEDLAEWQAGRLKLGFDIGHTTRMFPKRAAEILDGGSLYWVFKGNVLARQPILDLLEVKGDDGIERCRIVLAHELIRVRPMPKRPFQGWRYLRPEDAPADLDTEIDDEVPLDLRRELISLGLL
jgi:hypothetical protein